MRAIYITVAVITLILQFWKFLDVSNVQIFFSTITGDIHNGILKTLYS